ncbi:heme-binding protein [Jatrophihabitans sp. YIM 134969]
MTDTTQIPATPTVLPFSPHPSTRDDGGTTDPVVSTLGLLAGLVGTWSGSGLNAIWTPSQKEVTGNAHFLQLAPTVDAFEFKALDGTIPNRGLNQADLFMAGLEYANTISSNGKGIHFETGIWLAVPETQDPPVGETVARMASIPHGSTINAQGTATAAGGPPSFPEVDLTPFVIGQPGQTIDFDEQHLDRPTPFRTPDPAAHGFTQSIIDDMNTALEAVAGVTTTTVIHVSTPPPAGIPGGGSGNTAFLIPNATATATTATIWLQTVGDEPEPSVLQYSQVVMLDFNGLSWPHITIGTLRRVHPAPPVENQPTPE